MANAAIPTDFMVMALNQYGNIAPTMRPANSNGWRISTVVRPTVVTNAPKRASDTRAAEPTERRQRQQQDRETTEHVNACEDDRTTFGCGVPVTQQEEKGERGMRVLL
jgi:hypothetical protein